jgi:hypothetical protein
VDHRVDGIRRGQERRGEERRGEERTEVARLKRKDMKIK